MSTVERAIDYIKGRELRAVRTPELARHLMMIPGDVDILLEKPAAEGLLVVCEVEIGDGQIVKEYRPTTSAPTLSLGPLSTPKPNPWPASAAAHKTPDAQPAAFAPVRDTSKENPMAEKKPLPDRVVEALTQHGKLNLEQLAKHTGSTKGSLSTIMGTLCKTRGVRRGHGERGFYEMGSRQRDALASGAELGRRKPGVAQNGNVYSPALNELKTRRDTLQGELAKLESAITALEALAG